MATSTNVARSSKRKRTQVSYSADDYFESLDLDEDDLGIALLKDVDSKTKFDGRNSDDDSDGYSTRKGKAPPKKKVKTVHQSTKPKEKKPFPFLDLPAELRDEIYDLCLLQPGVDGLVLVARRRGSRKTVSRGVITTETSKKYHGKYRTSHTGFGYWQMPRTDHGKVGLHGDQYRTHKLVVKLLAVNKQIREEASSVLYKQDIVLEDPTALFSFISTIGDYNRQLVSDLTIKGWGQGKISKSNGKADVYNSVAFAMLSVCKNVQNLFLDCTLQGYSSPAQLAETVHSNLHLFLESAVAARGSIDAAVDVVQLADWNFDKTHRKRPEHGGTSSESGGKYRPVAEVKAEFREALKTLLTPPHRRGIVAPEPAAPATIQATE